MTGLLLSIFSKICTLAILLDLGEVKTAPTECQEKCFQMVPPAYLHYGKAPQNVLMLMIHLRKR